MASDSLIPQAELQYSNTLSHIPLQERPALWGLHPGSGAVYLLTAMEHLIPPGAKKVPKVYTAACHPLLPHLVAVAANSGAPQLSRLFGCDCRSLLCAQAEAPRK